MESTLVVYGDFNCPFCYALNELLFESNLKDSFEWRAIEHLPGISCDFFTPAEQSLLTTEVYNVRHRVPNLEIAVPPCRPNTAICNRALVSISQLFPDQTNLFRRAVYRALWVDGLDISSEEVLRSLLESLGLQGILSGNALSEMPEQLTEWQLDWTSERFEGRIPAIAVDDRLLLGLASLPDIESFLKGDVILDDNRTLTCDLKPLQSLAVIGELPSLWGFLATLRQQYHIRLLPSQAALQELIKTDQVPDLILIDLKMQGVTSLSVCESLKADPLTASIPLILVADEVEDEDEVKAYRIGVADFIRRDRSPEVFKARVDMLMKLKATQDELDRAARVDGLTQIYNRREFDRVLLQEWRRCSRARTKLSLLMVDVDYFKKYNDFYGHLAGDGCLRSLARTMKDCVERPSDFVSRYGGEEFAILLPDTGAGGAYRVAKKIQSRVAGLAIPHEASGVADRITVSIGICSVRPVSMANMLDLVATADSCLYKAKDQGRNCIVAESGE